MRGRVNSPLNIKNRFAVPPHAITFTATRASGPGGQGVNTTDSAVQLRCDLNAFHIPHPFRARILSFNDSRILDSGEVLIRAESERSQHRNRRVAIDRLRDLLERASYRPPKRKRTRPSRSSIRRAVKSQKRRKDIKALRRNPKPRDIG